MMSEGMVSFHFLRPLLFVANSMGLFKRVLIRGDATIPNTPLLLLNNDNNNNNNTTPTNEYFLAGAVLNPKLEVLEIVANRDGGLVTIGDYRALRELLCTTKTLRRLKLDKVTNVEESLLRQGLAANQTLRKLSLSFVQCDVPDVTIANIIHSLREHCELRHLTITSSGQFGPLSSEALRVLLSSSYSPKCKLKSLSLQGFEFFELDTTSGCLETDVLLDGIRDNRSLRNLLIGDALDGNMFFSKFFKLLTECPWLETLHLWEPNITQQDLEAVLLSENKVPRLERPLVIGLGFPVLSNLEATLTKVLQKHQEIRMEHEGFDGNDEAFVHLCQWNWYGRYLMDNKPEFPLSMWPIVLEKSNDKPNVIYEFLKGPAFAARQPYHI
ncbi:MAG: hypothetical protein SGBAC_010274 [Bacillariaceae sp.]